MTRTRIVAGWAALLCAGAFVLWRVGAREPRADAALAAAAAPAPSKSGTPRLAPLAVEPEAPANAEPARGEG